MHLKEHCIKIETAFHLFYAHLFLKNLVFKFNIALINSNLLFCLLINIWYITGLEVYQVSLHFFIRNSKILIRFSLLFLKVFSFKMLMLFLFFDEKPLLSNGEIVFMLRKSWAMLCMLDAPFGLSDWFSMIDLGCIYQIILL